MWTAIRSILGRLIRAASPVALVVLIAVFGGCSEVDTLDAPAPSRIVGHPS